MHEIIFAGFGGQGVILAGRLVCIAAMNEGKYVSHIPSYGAEMRGGTANCSIVISDEEIASPVIYTYCIVVLTGRPQEIRLKAEGELDIQFILIKEETDRKDLNIYGIPTNETSKKSAPAVGFMV